MQRRKEETMLLWIIVRVCLHGEYPTQSNSHYCPSPCHLGEARSPPKREYRSSTINLDRAKSQPKLQTITEQDRVQEMALAVFRDDIEFVALILQYGRSTGRRHIVLFDNRLAAQLVTDRHHVAGRYVGLQDEGELLAISTHTLNQGVVQQDLAELFQHRCGRGADLLQMTVVFIPRCFPRGVRSVHGRIAGEVLQGGIALGSKISHGRAATVDSDSAGLAGSVTSAIDSSYLISRSVATHL